MTTTRTVLLVAACTVLGCKGSGKKPAGTPGTSATPAAGTAAGGADADLAVLAKLAKDGPDTDVYPQADAVIALERDDITLGADGTVTHHHKSIVKLLDAQRGKEKFADVHIPFDSKRQTLDLAVARTVNADGVPHAASPDEIGDIVPQRLADATIYSDVRERVVSFPAVDTGSVVELEYTRTTKGSPDSAMGGEEMLGTWDPVLSRIVTITVPAGTAPKLAVVGATLTATEATTGGAHTYTYAIANQPDRHPEMEAPSDETVLPRLVYGFLPSWAKALEPIADRFLAAAVPATMPDAVTKQAATLTGSAATTTDKAMALFKFVAHDVRSVDLPLGWAGYEPHAPDVVLANRYADQRDKVGLLLALCHASGIEGEPVMVRTGHVQVIASVPTVAQFDRVVAKVTVDGKDVWLDPTDESGQYGITFAGQDNLVLPVAHGGAEVTAREALDPSTSISHTTATLALSANGDLDVKYNYNLTGWYADRASDELRPLKGEHLSQYFHHAAGALSAAAIDKDHAVSDTMSVTGPVEVTHHVSIPGYSQEQSSFRVLELPAMTLGLADDLPTAGLSKRESPLWIGVPRTATADVSITIPAGWKVAHVPPDLDGAVEGLTYAAKCATTGQTVTCHDEVKLDKLELAPDKYPAFHDAITQLQSYGRRIVLLTKA